MVEAHDRLKKSAPGKTGVACGWDSTLFEDSSLWHVLGTTCRLEFRKQVDEDVAVYGIEALRNRLQQVDPLSAHKILPNDVRRMARALEVVRATVSH